MSGDAYFRTRFTHDRLRDVLWRTPCRDYFSRFILPTDCVLELGGSGYFINGITARRRPAVDSWHGFVGHFVGQLRLRELISSST